MNKIKNLNLSFEGGYIRALEDIHIFMNESIKSIRGEKLEASEKDLAQAAINTYHYILKLRSIKDK